MCVSERGDNEFMWCFAVSCSVLQCVVKVCVSERGEKCVHVMCVCQSQCCSMLQCAAVCCSVLQCVAMCCSVLQCVAVCCSVLQCVAVCCSVTLRGSVMQYVAVCCSALHTIQWRFVLWHANLLQERSMTHSDTWHDVFRHVLQPLDVRVVCACVCVLICVTRPTVGMYSVIHEKYWHACRDSIACVPWLIPTFDMTRLHVRCLIIDVCDMTHLSESHNALLFIHLPFYTPDFISDSWLVKTPHFVSDSWLIIITISKSRNMFSESSDFISDLWRMKTDFITDLGLMKSIMNDKWFHQRLMTY